MKLSEAIREGVKQDGPQCFNEFFSFDGGCCAMGAAWLGLGRSRDASVLCDFIFEDVGFTRITDGHELDCPGQCPRTFNALSDLIFHLNDGHRWTREAIADQLDAWGF